MIEKSPLITVFFSLCLALPLFGQTSATWQQEVTYEMEITLYADRHQMDGTQRLTYTNHSPDTLHRVYYHLYFNAFHPNSMMAERNRHLPDPDGRIVPRIWNLGPDEVGYHEIESLTQDGRDVPFKITDTVMRVDLAEPIPPGASTTFEMRFNSQVPLQTRRSGRDNREGIDYSMSQWYPKMAEYDERGWHADPYVGREFYAPYGTFDVRITLPAEYVIGATGVLQNPEEIGHGYESPSTVKVMPSGTDGGTASDSLTWHFVAENVHDFAWAADPDFIHERIDGDDGRVYHLLYQPEVADRWEPMSDWVPAIIQFYSREYGSYPYPQFTVAQAGDGGMEYPMINFLTGRRSPRSLLGVTAHEAAHEWFYATMGSNEADYPWMDEGFTSYATTEAVTHVLGGDNPGHQGALLSVVALQHRDLFERLNTPADWFTTNAAYGVASYPGGEMVVEMLGYVISDSLRDAWLQEYYRRFKFRHPNPYDLEKIAEDVSGLRLDWYFEQFTQMTRPLDYAVTDLTSQPSGEGYTSLITLRRKEDVVMPVDVRLTLEDGSTQWVTIPLGIMQGHKPVPDDWVVADPWRWTFSEYTFTFDAPQRVVKAELDPEQRMPDRNRLNNTSGFPLRARFLHPPPSSWSAYGVGYRPLLQYADDFGVGAGMQARGQYLFGQYRLQAMVKLWPEVLFSGGEDPSLGFGSEVDPDLSAFDGIDYELALSHDVSALGREATASLSLQKHLGVLEHTLALSKALGAYGSSTQQRLRVAAIHQFIPSNRDFEVDNFPWFLDENIASARLSYRVASDQDWIKLAAEVGTSFDDQLNCGDVSGDPVACVGEFRQSATHLTLGAQKVASLGRFLGTAQFKLGLGQENLAFHKRFRLGAASIEEAWRNAAFRSVSAAFDDALQDVHLSAMQGPGPVAYVLAATERDRGGRPVGGTPIGTSMIAGRLSLSSGAVSSNRWGRPLRAEVFSGVGTTWGTSTFGQAGEGAIDFDADNLVADAGISVSYDVSQLASLQRWTAQSDVLSGLKLVAAFPVWASDPDLIDADENAFAFRWLLGISVGE